jgi:hypothetical protein
MISEESSIFFPLVLFTATVFLFIKLAEPLMNVTFLFFSRLFSPLSRNSFTTSFFLLIIFFKSTLKLPILIPYSFERFVMYAAFALAAMVLEGVHP